jgi:hypothetical protein
MEEIKNILGLRIHNGVIMDRFTWSLAMACERIANKFVGKPESTRAEKEMGPLEARAKIVDDEEDKAYGRALRQLAKLRPAYKKYLLGAKASGFISNLLKKRMCLAIWVGTGNKIPFGDLNKSLLRNLLKERGYTYRRNELKWYRGGLPIGKDLFGALEHLEKLETIDRTRLTISF